MRRYAFVAPDQANPHDSLGEVLMTVGRYEEAEVEFRTALAKDPLFFYSQKNIGWIYLLRGQVDRSLELIDQVRGELAGSMFSESLAVETVVRLFEHGLSTELDLQARRFLAEYPESKERSSVRIRWLLGTGQTAAAMAVLDSVITDYQQSKWWGENVKSTARVQTSETRLRALAAENLGIHDEAAELFREVLSRLQDAPPHYKIFDRIHLAYNLIPLRAYDEARVQVAEALRVNPRIAEGVLVAASIEAAAGEVTEARRLLDSVERILERADPDYPTLLEARRLREQLPDPDRI
jgi:tetratricopeptide (TPR) repeat protein